MPYQITGTVPLDGQDRFTPEAVASMRGATVTMLGAEMEPLDRIGTVTIEGASIERETGDLRLTVSYDDKTDKHLREHGYGRKDLKTLAISGHSTAYETTDAGARTISAFDLHAVAPRIAPRVSPRIAPRS